MHPSTPVFARDLHGNDGNGCHPSPIPPEPFGFLAEMGLAPEHWPHTVVSGKSLTLALCGDTMCEIPEQVERAARHAFPVLVTGESGTGKSTVGRLIHQISGRSNKQCVVQGCANLTGDLFESTLFGHCKGAFTGAHADRTGRLRQAANGTLVLDEVDQLHNAEQAKLLRVLQDGEFEPVGSEQTFKDSARWICTCNQPMASLVRMGRFRHDLYWRMAVVLITIPPLRERRADIPFLAASFIAEVCRQHDYGLPELSESLVEELTARPWFGNLRELENAMKVLVSHCGDHAAINADDFRRAVPMLSGYGAVPKPPTLHARSAADGHPPAAGAFHHAPASPPLGLSDTEADSLDTEGDSVETQTPQIPAAPAAERPLQSLPDKVAQVERQHIIEVLRECMNNRTKAAEVLEISRVKLYERLSRYNITDDDVRY